MSKKILEDQIVHANDAYRAGLPILTDTAFDDLLDSYRAEYGDQAYTSLRITLSDPTGEVKHPIVMGSLEKLKAEEPEDVEKWLTKINETKQDVLVSAKIDGMSARLKFNDEGVLIEAATRGDGETGQNIYEKVIKSNCIHMTHVAGACDVRGELFIKESRLAELNKTLDIPYKNARNAIVGIMNRKELDVELLQYVSFIAYEIMGTDWFKYDQYIQLDIWGFELPYFYKISSHKDYIQKLLDLYEEFKSSCDYLIDGLVLCTIDYIDEGIYLPKKMKAFKVNDLVAKTKLLDVVFEGPSKNGRFIPVGLLDPVELGGASIGRVSCYNYQWMIESDLRYGSNVTIIKSGDIIPKLVEVEFDENLPEVEAPEYCPSCNTELTRDGVDLKCPNHLKCPAQNIHKVTQFIKRLDVDNVSQKSLELFAIYTYEDLISWKPNKSKSQQAFYNEMMTKVFTTPEIDILGSLDFDSIGRKTFDKIVDHYGYENIKSEYFWRIYLNKDLPGGVGDITLQKFLRDIERNVKVMEMVITDERWRPLESSPDISSDVSSGYLNDQSFCFTGALSEMSRKDAQAKVKQLGGDVKSSVTKGLTYLVTNDTNTGTSKNRKARELSVKLINEEEFTKMISGDNETTIDEVFGL